jgi:hypothetical protein
LICSPFNPHMTEPLDCLNAASTDRYRVERELGAGGMAARQHLHILPLHGAGQANGFLCDMMPWVEGIILRQPLSRDGEPPISGPCPSGVTGGEP